MVGIIFLGTIIISVEIGCCILRSSRNQDIYLLEL